MTREDLAKMIFCECAKNGGSVYLRLMIRTGKTAMKIAKEVAATTNGIDAEQVQKEVPTLAKMEYGELPKHWHRWFTGEAEWLIGLMKEVGGRDAVGGLNLGNKGTISTLTHGSHWKRLYEGRDQGRIVDDLRLLQEWIKASV